MFLQLFLHPPIAKSFSAKAAPHDGLETMSQQYLRGSVRTPGIFFYPCPTGDLLEGELSAVRVQCKYLDV